VAQKPRNAVVNFFYRNLQRHRAVLPAIARLLSLRSIDFCKFQSTLFVKGPQYAIFERFKTVLFIYFSAFAFASALFIN